MKSSFKSKDSKEYLNHFYHPNLVGCIFVHKARNFFFFLKKGRTSEVGPAFDLIEIEILRQQHPYPPPISTTSWDTNTILPELQNGQCHFSSQWFGSTIGGFFFILQSLYIKVRSTAYVNTFIVKILYLNSIIAALVEPITYKWDTLKTNFWSWDNFSDWSDPPLRVTNSKSKSQNTRPKPQLLSEPSTDR